MKNIILVMSALLFSPLSFSATLLIDEFGQLTGATGVDIDGAFYDVSFTDGTCIDLFYGCDANTDFAFQNATQASIAAQALLDQVLLDGATGQFDSQPDLTNGCSFAPGCNISIPYLFIDSDTVLIRFALNEIGGDLILGSLVSAGQDLVISSTSVFAVFAPTPVPLPVGAWLFFSAICSLAGIKLKQRSNT